jgi:hypothetical protein
MEYREILDFLAPCGLNCRKCLAHTEGEIAGHSIELQKLLGNFDIYAERFSNFLPVFQNYPSFKKLLSYLAEPDCQGCRHFCFQCAEFPCEKTNFDPHLKARWIKMNRRMKEIGVEAYYEEIKDVRRYL